jgi:hypothetical protein
MNDGGQAFLCAGNIELPGMPLRDWFAGQALVGYMTEENPPDVNVIAEVCYAAADAMLVVRELKKEQA